MKSRKYYSNKFPVVNSEHDAVGIHVARLLNDGIFLRLHENLQKEQPSSCIFPLFSVSNYIKVKCFLMLIWSRISHFVTRLKQCLFHGEKSRGTIIQPTSCTWIETICGVVKVLLFLIIPIISITIAVIISFLARIFFFLIISIITLLVDLTDVCKVIPKSVQRSVEKCICMVKTMDRKYLYGGFFKGRNQWGDGIRRKLADRKSPDVLLRASGYDEKQRMNLLHKESFQHVDWCKVRNYFKEKSVDGVGFDSKTVDHLVALNFAYVMMHGEHKSLMKGKHVSNRPTSCRKRNMDDKITTDTKYIVGENDVDMNGMTSIGDKGSVFRAMQSGDGIEMVTTTKITHHPRELKRQRSSQRRSNNMKYFDDTAEILQYQSSPSRPRVYSEADLEDYEICGSEDNSVERDTDAKNKKWLDVGARLGMRILKSEPIQELIAQKTISADMSGGDLEYDNELDFSKANGQIPKPVHSMWQIGDDGRGFDDVSDEFSTIGSDVSESSFTESRRRRASIVLSSSPFNRKRSSHLSCSPTRTTRNLFHGKCSSVPSSPRRNLSGRRLSSAGFLDDFGVNASTVSSEAIRWVPKEFDANMHLPASMAIDHGFVSERYFNSGMKMKKEEIHRQREPLLSGVKIVIPLFPLYSNKPKRTSLEGRIHQLATVVSSERISLNNSYAGPSETDGISITVLLDRSFLRNGKFVKMTLRIPDSQRHFPRHSKFPIGVPVATSFGTGILVGWRTKDDCHIVRSLWKKRGDGSGHAYLNRSFLHGVLEASVGFKIETTLGSGKVIAYVDVGKKFLDGKFLVQMKRHGRKQSELDIIKGDDILQCPSAKFIPVVEQLKEAAKYQMQVDNYEAERLQVMLQEESLIVDKTWRVFSEGFELFLTSFITAAEEADDFDSEINKFLSNVIEFLEDFELDGGKKRFSNSFTSNLESPEPPLQQALQLKNQVDENDASVASDSSENSNFWFIKDLFDNIINKRVPDENSEKIVQESFENFNEIGKDSYKKVYDVLTIFMRTISIAKAGCTNKPNLKMALAIIHEMLLFIHNVIKVQQVNMTRASTIGWKETLDDLATIFGPANARLQKIGQGILQRLEDHGKVAKLKALAFADYLVSDDGLVESLETGNFKDCVDRVENAAVLAKIINEDLREKYHKLGAQIYNTLAPRTNYSAEAASRNGKKFTIIAKAVRLMVTPARSALTLLTNDDILEAIERILVRVFEREQEASQVINIYSWNFRTLRHLRILNNMAIVGNLWAPILDAADEEFIWAVSRTPEQTQQYIKPISKLFSLGVARFHEIHKSDSNVSTDWLDFLKEDEAIQIIQELDGALLAFLRSFCKDMKEMVYILPYYSSIDDDILNLIDEFDPEKELRDIADALAEPAIFSNYIREKSAVAVSKFLDYLPKMSIPIDRREVGDGWVLTCRGRNGKDLTLSNVSIKQENLLCKVFGGHNIIGLDDVMLSREHSMDSLMKDNVFSSDKEGNIEISILDHVAELIKNAQNHGCWNVDGGTHVSPSLTTSSLCGLPLSRILKCSIELWENLEIDDDELLEIAIREISHHIQLQAHNDHNGEFVPNDIDWAEERRNILDKHEACVRKGVSFDVDIVNTLSIESNSSVASRRFDPKTDPTVLFIGMNELTCSLDDFTYRLEPVNRNSIFDPVLEGVGSLTIKNASLRIRIECRKERIEKLGEELIVPVLQVQELEIGMESVNFLFKETGVDWLLNKIIDNFSSKITNVVKENLQGQLSLALEKSLETINKYIEVNPELMLKILGITIDDIEENVAWV